MKIQRRSSLWQVVAILVVAIMVPLIAWRLLLRLSQRFEDSSFGGAQFGLNALVSSPDALFWIERVLLAWWCISCLLWVVSATRGLLKNERGDKAWRVDKERRRG